MNLTKRKLAELSIPKIFNFFAWGKSVSCRLSQIPMVSKGVVDTFLMQSTILFFWILANRWRPTIMVFFYKDKGEKWFFFLHIWDTLTYVGKLCHRLITSLKFDTLTWYDTVHINQINRDNTTPIAMVALIYSQFLHTNTLQHLAKWHVKREATRWRLIMEIEALKENLLKCVK